MGKAFDYARALVLFVTGFILVFLLDVDKFFAPILTLDVLNDVSPMLVVGIGILAMVGGVLIAFSQTRVVGYVIGVAVTGTFAICSVISLFIQPEPHSALGFMLIPAAISYAGGMYLAIQDEFKD